jgi:hypothetical protein
MSHDTDVAPAVGPLLPILSTIGWILTGLILFIPTLFSPMLFDSGTSFWAVAAFVGLLSSLMLCFVSVVGAWIIWATTRRHRGGPARIFRGIIYLLPLIGIITTVIGFAGIEFLCSGNLTCVE